MASSKSMRPAGLHLFESPFPQAEGTLIVIIPGHVISGLLVSKGLLPKLTARGDVLVVEHPRRGSFSFEQEAAQIAARIETIWPQRLVLIPMSMGARVATALIPELAERGLLDALRAGGIIAECPFTEASDVKGPIKFWWGWRWPRFLNLISMKLMNDRNPDFYVDDFVGVRKAWIQKYWRAQAFFRNSGRRGQMEAMANVNPLRRLRLVGTEVPLRVITSGVDPLLHPSAAERFAAAFGHRPEDVITELPKAWHCAHPEQFIWDDALLAVLKDMGI